VDEAEVRGQPGLETLEDSPSGHSEGDPQARSQGGSSLRTGFAEQKVSGRRRYRQTEAFAFKPKLAQSQQVCVSAGQITSQPDGCAQDAGSFHGVVRQQPGNDVGLRRGSITAVTGKYGLG